MTWIDIAAIIIVLLSAAISAVRGFVREVLGVGAWIAAGLAAIRFFPYLEPEIASILPASMKNFTLYGAMAMVFLIVLILLSLVSALIGGLVRDSPLASLDHSLGMLFGAARGCIIICIAYIGLGFAGPAAQWPAPVANARFLPMAYAGAQTLTALLPKDYRPKLTAPPGTALPGTAPTAPPPNQKPGASFLPAAS